MGALCEYRKQNGLTQAALAQRLGISQSAVAHLESGSRKPRPKLVLLIEEVTGIPRHEIRPDIYPIDSAA